MADIKFEKYLIIYNDDALFYTDNSVSTNDCLIQFLDYTGYNTPLIRKALLCVSVYNDFNNSIEDFSKRCEIKNQIASLSNYRFVDAFDYIANAICERRSTPNTETYMSLGKKAVELLASGVEQADVLDYFDELLEKEKSK